MNDSVAEAAEYPRAMLMRYPRVLDAPLRAGVATIGNFDGVHIGHQRVFAKLRQIAGQRPTTVVSFYPHPVSVLKAGSQVRSICSVREKAEQCAAHGMDLLYLVHFTSRFAQMSAVECIEQIFIKALGITDLVVGDDVHIGRNREGSRDFLARTLPQYGINLHIVERLTISGEKAGSRKIRDLIEQGLVSEAAQVMGRPFTISARVGHGEKLGSKLGFPTANIAVGRRLIPRRGVYACKATIHGHEFNAVANIGVRPTFHGVAERLEVHILDYTGETLYGTRLHVAFLARLRDEKRFDSKEDLQRQIACDIQEARVRLGHVE
jgi:riboflavin kinase/FMN adenylyltransferase